MDHVVNDIDANMWLLLLKTLLCNRIVLLSNPGTLLPDLTTPKSIAASYFESSNAFQYLSLFSLLANRKSHPPRVWWVECRQNTHWKFVEPIVWRPTEEMEHDKFVYFYRMSPAVFGKLVEILTPYLQSDAEFYVRPLLELRKIVAIVVYRFAQGLSPEHIADRFHVGASTIHKYIDKIAEILSDKNKLFNRCISIPTRPQLQKIIYDFEEITGLPNICGAFDSTHIPLATKPNRKVTLISSDYYNRKKRDSIVLQAVCDTMRIFSNVCAGQPGGVHDEHQFQVSSLYKDLRTWSILQSPVVDVGRKLCTPYLIGDSAYPIRMYLQKNWRSLENENKKNYDSAMNLGRVVIENAFGSLKNQWRILKNFNSRVDKAPRITIACCWLHNFCQQRNVPEPGGNTGRYRDPLQGFRNVRLRVYREGEKATTEGKELMDKLFQYWILRNP